MNTISVILGNGCSLLATLADSISTTRKTTKGVLLMQSLGQLMYCFATILLKGYSGSVQNVVSILRNFVAIRKINNPLIEWILVLLGVVFGLLFNNLGLIGLLPVIGNLQYTLAIFKFKDNDYALKISFAILIALYAIFNCTIFNFVGAACNLVVLVTTLVMIFKQRSVKI